MIRLIAPAIVIAALSIAAIAAPKRPAKKHLLVVTWTTGFRHADTIGPNPTQDGPAQKILKDIGDSSGVYDVDYCRSQEDVKAMLTPDGLKKYDGVFFANTTGNIGIPDLKAFCDWVKAGHAFIGTHSAGDTYHPSDTNGDTSYIDMVGCEFRTHGAQSEVQCIVEDPKHPAVKHWPSSFTIKDEIYHFRVNNRSTVHVLLALKTQGMDGVKDPKTNEDMSGKPTDMLISWCKNYGKGKVFYTALGHRPDVWARPDYQQHLLGGIKWALGLEKGSAKTPSDTK
jgi:type 1 glutamine amidotransferase